MAADALALAMLGPGAHSIDAWLFGRREIVIPDEPRRHRAGNPIEVAATRRGVALDSRHRVMSPSLAASMLPAPPTVVAGQAQGAAMGLAVAIAPREERVPVRNGLQIFIRSWIPAAAAARDRRHRARRQVAQRLLPLGGEATGRPGFAVYALDLHGRGQSDGERFYLEQMADYVDDAHTLVTLAKCRHPAVPFFLLGHSAGGVISSVYTLEHQAELAGFICESFAFQVYAPDFALAVVKGLSHVVAARARAEPEDRGLLPRSGGGAGDARRSADRRRSRSRPTPSPSWPAPTSG